MGLNGFRAELTSIDPSHDVQRLKGALEDLRSRLVNARQKEVAARNRDYALKRIDGVLGTLGQIDEALAASPMDTSLPFSIGRGLSEWSDDEDSIALGYSVDQIYSELHRAVASESVEDSR